MQEQPKASMGMSPMRTTPPLPGEEMRRGGKTKKWEGSAKDEMQDKKLAKKRGMSMKAWEASEGDKKHDKQQSMAGLKKGGRAAKADGGKMDPRNAGGGGGGPSGNDLMHAMVPLTMLMKKGGRVGKAGGGAMAAGSPRLAAAFSAALWAAPRRLAARARARRRAPTSTS
jgi:hypothetical protein